MYKLTPEQVKTQSARLKNVDLRLVVGFLKTALRYIAEYPDAPLPIIVEGYRPYDVQAKYYAQGRTTPGPIITTKLPGTSKHNRNPAEAIDIGFLEESGSQTFDDVNYRRFYELWKEHTLAFTWGGVWQTLHDLPHFEVAPA